MQLLTLEEGEATIQHELQLSTVENRIKIKKGLGDSISHRLLTFTMKYQITST